MNSPKAIGSQQTTTPSSILGPNHVNSSGKPSAELRRREAWHGLSMAELPIESRPPMHAPHWNHPVNSSSLSNQITSPQGQEQFFQMIQVTMPTPSAPPLELLSSPTQGIARPNNLGQPQQAKPLSGPDQAGCLYEPAKKCWGFFKKLGAGFTAGGLGVLAGILTIATAGILPGLFVLLGGLSVITISGLYSEYGREP